MNNNLNKLSEEDIDNLWFPNFQFKNIASPDSYEESESSRNWTVIRNFSYTHQKLTNEKIKISICLRVPKTTLNLPNYIQRYSSVNMTYPGTHLTPRSAQ